MKSVLALFILLRVLYSNDFNVIERDVETKLRLVSYNVHYSSVFPQDDGMWESNKPNRVAKFKRVFKALDADIWAFQEVFHSGTEFKVRTPETIKAHLETVSGEKLWMSHDYVNEGGVQKGGRLLVSRYPIVHERSVNGRAHASLIELPEEISKKKLLVINVHFVIAKTGQDSQSKSTATFINDVMSGKYKKDIPADIMIVLCGDFNAKEGTGIAYKNISENISLVNQRPSHLGWSPKNYYTCGGVGFEGDTEEEIKKNSYTPDLIGHKTIDYLYWRDNEELAVRNCFIFNTLIMDDESLAKYKLQPLDVSTRSSFIETEGKGYVGCDHFPYFVDLISQNVSINSTPSVHTSKPSGPVKLYTLSGRLLGETTMENLQAGNYAEVLNHHALGAGFYVFKGQGFSECRYVNPQNSISFK